VPTIVLNDNADLSAGKILFKKLTPDKSGIASVLSALHSSNILSVIVEGGTKLLQSFINEGVWDEMRVITNTQLIIDEGVSAPDFRNANHRSTESFGTDSVAYYTNTKDAYGVS
ncbi:MAG TPA: dihydrofolate reductase family protein, partial [Puia sp.]